ncbi:Pikachurin [Frankliniella fusca]|uniref:Pikachurin n=1 Tax=Frankliniella fusca TaxID=407009 RepID=A0AAE1H9Y6_9NEOP|nr:Pikachurin [Frankliniella fusca]
MHVEFRPEAPDGVLLLAGERDDLTGDYLAVVLNKGFVEFRFDCGSGQGVVRSDETVVLNEWNRVSVHRQRWDASVRLNAGKWVTGRSKGLFSRITFREPLFLGGPGNTTGLVGKLPVDLGLHGCVRHLEVNGQVYDLSEDAMQGFDVEECGAGADRCSSAPCLHGGTCVSEAAAGPAVCLCPLGWAGERCDSRVDLDVLVPSFNGSSYLRYPGLGDAALSWLDLQLTLKPAAPSGVVLYNGARAAAVPGAGGDFVALALVDGHLEFSFDLGSGTAVVRSARPVSLGEWHEVRVSRTGRLAVLQVDDEAGAEVVAPGAFLQLSLPLSLYLGGLPPAAAATAPSVAPSLRDRPAFVGCIQKVLVNERPLHLLEHALAGVNVDTCPHPCGARPCSPRGRCVPRGDSFTCLCPGADPGADPAGQQPVTDCVSEHDPRVLEHRLSAGFSGNGHIHFTDMETVRRSLSDTLRVNMRLRTTSSSGLVLWLGRRPEDDDEEVRAVHQRHGVHPSFGNDFLAVAVHDGLVHLRLDLGSGELFLGYNLTRVDDGKWHRINVNRRGQEATISVDNGPAFGRTAPGRLRQLNANTGLYVGGAPDPQRLTRGRYSTGMVGCVADLVLGEDLDYHVRLDAPSGESVNVAACG